jgi:hypothetical protein
MEQWRSLREIVEAFSLPVESSHATARAELLRLLAKIHPDKSSGEFTSGEDEARYHKIQSAMRAIDELKAVASSVVPYAEHPISIQLEERRELRAEESVLRSQISNAVRSQFRIRKIGSAILASAIAGTMAFSAKIIEHPIVSAFLSYMDTHLPLFRPAIGVVFLMGILGACAARNLSTTLRRLFV